MVMMAQLVDLESFLEDIDNARDFHTIGGWPVLANTLLGHFSDHVRALGTWLIVCYPSQRRPR